jgi:hypothetical protein
MATVTSCPKCSEKLRLPDELLGQRVRCPQCSNIFEAAAAAPTPSPVPPRAPGLDVPLNFSLDDSATGGSSARKKPVGAVEMNAATDDKKSNAPDAPVPKPAPAPDRSERPRERKRETNDDRETDRDGNEMKRCPVCRRSNHRDSRRCYHCGERLSEGPRASYPDRDRFDDDFARPRRRDTVPHRGGVVLAMGIVSLVALLVIPAIGIPFGIIGWIMGQVDLRQMKNDQMDRDGEGMTRAGWVCSILGTVINSLYLLLCCGFFGMMMYADTYRPRTTKSYYYSPPPQQKMNKDWPPPQENWKDVNDFPKEK